VRSDLLGYKKHGPRADGQACLNLDIALDISAGGGMARGSGHQVSGNALRAESTSKQESSLWRACLEIQKCM
jgi:hypothetical protein